MHPQRTTRTPKESTEAKQERWLAQVSTVLHAESPYWLTWNDLMASCHLPPNKLRWALITLIEQREVEEEIFRGRSEFRIRPPQHR